MWLPRASTALSCDVHGDAIYLPRGAVQRGLYSSQWAGAPRFSLQLWSILRTRAPPEAGGPRGRTTAAAPPYRVQQGSIPREAIRRVGAETRVLPTLGAARRNPRRHNRCAGAESRCGGSWTAGPPGLTTGREPTREYRRRITCKDANFLADCRFPPRSTVFYPLLQTSSS